MTRIKTVKAINRTHSLSRQAQAAHPICYCIVGHTASNNQQNVPNQLKADNSADSDISLIFYSKALRVQHTVTKTK